MRYGKASGRNRTRQLQTANIPSGGARHHRERILAVFNVERSDIWGSIGICPFTFVASGKTRSRDETERSRSVSRHGVRSRALGSLHIAAIPYRTEYRYRTESKKIILQNSGHICQNPYLASESIGCRTCAIGAYDQDLIDDIKQRTRNGTYSENAFIFDKEMVRHFPFLIRKY
jgi:hypothetical protein